MAKALVTGGAGFIGSHLCERLVDQGWQVVVLDNFSSGRRDNIAHLGPAVEIIDADVMAIGDYMDHLAGIERIYHLAALISGHDSLYEPEAYVDANINGLSRVIDAACDLGGPRLFFASSSTVYGDRQRFEDHRCAETDPTDPWTVYAMTKEAGEKLLAIYGRLQDLDAVSLRLFNVYGPRQNPDHPYANVTCKFAYAAAHDLPIKRYGDGYQSRDFIYVGDVIDAFMALGQARRSAHAVYNVGTGHATSINTLIELIQAVGGASLTVEQHQAWPNDIRTICANTDRLAAEFDFRPQVQLADGLRRTVDYFRNTQPLSPPPARRGR